jgi:uncharacterized membrane protein HdeD (DUF308 family)
MLRGISVGLLGILLLTRPAATIAFVVMIMGIYWLFAGLLTAYESIKGRKHQDSWGMSLSAGIVSIVAGAIVLSRPIATALLTTTFLLYMIAFAAILGGLIKVYTGVKLRREVDDEWSMIFSGTVHILLGLMILSRPLVTAGLFIWIFGFLALMGGIALIVVAVRMRSAASAASAA